MSIKNNDILVGDVMLKTNQFPVIDEKVILKETLEIMNNNKLGIACIINNSNKLTGVFTDGDFRRLILKNQKPLSRLFLEDIKDISCKSFISIKQVDKLSCALELMEINKIWDLPVIDNESKLIGLVHLHPVVKALI